MSKKIVVAVFVVEEDVEGTLSYENVSVDVDKATGSLPQINQWVGENVISARMKAIGLSNG